MTAPSDTPSDHAILQLIFDNGDGILVISAEGVVLFANPAAGQLLRASGTELVGTDFGHPVVAGEVTEIDIADTGRLADMRVSAIDWNGRPALLASLRDITDRRLAERTRDQLAAIVESSDDAIIWLDKECTIRSWNRGAENLYGYDRWEMLGRPVATITASDTALEREHLLGRVLGDGQVERFETRDVRKDGTEVDVAVTDSPIRDEGGSVTGIARVARDISARKRMEAELAFLAERDPLTGVFNRRRMHEELVQQCARAVRYEEVAGLLVADIDNFKHINDSLGHAVGDEVIKQVTGSIKKQLRETDLLARLGGDEFAVLLPRTDLDGTVRTARSLCAAVAGLDAPIHGHRIRITMSVGVAEIPGEMVSAEDALAVADVAMYEAKRLGRNRVVVGGATLGRSATEVLEMSKRLRDALREQRFELWAQPIIHLSSGTVAAYELLLRLRQDGHLLQPDSFIPTAERYGLIGDIDRWVVRRALELATLPEMASFSLSINLAGTSVGDRRLLDDIRDGVRREGIDPGRLIFEITETAAISAIETARTFIDDLHRTGCVVALDDFGSGFASFYYLKYLPIDYLKIDGDFIRTLPASDGDRLVVKAIMDVAQGLGKHTVAEHVGSTPAADMLRELGVEYGQGYHLGRPRLLS